MAEIKIGFPDGSVKPFGAGVTVLEIAKSIGTSLAKNAVAGKVNDELVNLDQPLDQDGKVEIITKDSEDGQLVNWNSAALVLTSAIKSIYPEIRIGEIGNIEHGFYADTDKEGQQISVDELPAIEDKMKDMIQAKVALSHEMLSVEDALAKVDSDPYQAKLVKKNAKDGKVNVYDVDGSLIVSDCVALPDASGLKAIKLLSVAGAYWEGKSSNPMLQRIYGTSFFNQKDLDAELARQKEARERDHRVIGNDLDLFFVDPEVGAGLPYWMPNGATIRRTIERYIIDKEVQHGYQHVYTPVLMNLDAYKTSGHWQHYREDMFPPMDMGDGEMLELRPMNCPSHIQVYKHHIRSYRELPLRIAELGMMHRYEKSGALSGLQRVREMTLNDGHTFVAPDQIQEEFKKVLQLMVEVYRDFDITDYTFRLSYRDPENTEKYFDDDEMWNHSQSMLKAAMDDLGLDYVEAEGEAAFYGPKLDVQTKTALGNEETLSTIQLDFMLPKQFDLHYVGADGEEHRPVMIHRGLVSTMERFTAYLIEMYKGAFPTWLAPKQVTIIPVKDDLHGEYADKLREQMADQDIRVEVDHRNEKMGYKIREAQTQKIPYILVVGDNEMDSNAVSVRRYGEDDSQTVSVNQFMQDIKDDIDSYSRKN
ncbi:threonine--tRNA ligase [Pediococcus acidilactici]|uniref:threonine--tRNA ligase n=1 Tax=Pediococcus acidilactici TaxID=1254 RepID=UPI000BEECB06|nr:threonine--tRNA ligase [Pediococcus acidilactici]MCQ0050228.1 threonine--tRNA ligase [Pediococcus acidilactici]MCQ0052038.1 threonine--tRNA ligase [Pediococcus acidilactici]MCQ0054087.1 threonine--tRNA ligase [Pediococcus acidilactici]MCQ0060892.1 threonine--tRNA ligase [Pediococcus acidilactici]MCQ0067795.1 threonine--tRNA ligase [Pediococcus acidilactici]